MKYAVEYLPERGYAKAQISGFPIVEPARECALGVFALAAEHDCTKVLLDATQVTEDSGISVIYGFYSRLERFGCDRRMRVALVRNGRMETDHFIETVARNRGFGLRVFRNLEDAEAWLMGEPVVRV
jgi:hypothetical protein